ncbi:MAG: cytochrome c oxidase subunit [Solirubrobacteraceae bacterium]|nr:cytochrome c oxidase subunit [Solirubrobacteraceae bacterium]
MRLVPSTRRRLFAAVLLAAAAALLLLAPSALADYITPESGGGSRNAEDIDTLFKWVLGVAAVVFFGVEGALLYSLLRFRRRRRDQVAAQIRGNTSLEIGWTVGAALVLVVITIVTFIMLPGIKNPARSGPGGVNANGPALFATIDQPNPPGDQGITIQVNGQQYVWRYTYPNRAYSYETMVVPTNTTVVLKLNAQDVIHSWWVPKLGGKMDAVPGYTNKTWFKISHEGVYRGQCAELCGRGHAEMIATVTAVSPTKYEAWVNAQKRLIDQANQQAAQQRRTLSPIPQ